MEFYKKIIYDYLVEIGTHSTLAKYLNMLALLMVLLIVVFILDYILRRLIRALFSKIAAKSKTRFDDILISNKAPRNIAHIIPLLIVIEYIPIIFFDFPVFQTFTRKTLEVFAIVLALWIVRSLLNTVKDYLKSIPNLKDKPIDSYIQVFMIFAWIVGSISAFAVITGIPFVKFFTGLGALSAVIILVFRDAILGFVASIQVSINDMVRIGDWITFDKYGANGYVTEISLATVKVQNFDNTITTIPTYALISDSFQNWRGMTDSDGRRIMRSLFVKQNSIKFLKDNEVEKLKAVQLITDYLEDRQSDIKTYNANINANKELLINGRNLTNFGVFRKYIDSYLNHHSGINKDMMLMVRQLEPTTQGIPLQIYAFSSDKRWANYEYIMADIFDHLIAALSYFELELFELPSNTDFIKPEVVKTT